jgi:hypothetical protein
MISPVTATTEQNGAASSASPESAPAQRVGAENSVTLCDLQVFVYEATEPVSSQRPDGRSGGPIGAASGRLLMERSVRTVVVVMLDVLAQHRREVTRSDDQEMIEAFTAQTADEPFRDRVRSRCPHWGADDADVRAGEDRVKGGSELAVPVADQKPEPRSVITQVHEQLAGLLGKPGAGGMSGDAGDVHAAAAVLDHHQDVEATQEDGVDVGEVDGEDRLGLGGEELLPGWPDRFRPESMPADFRIFIA